MGVAALQNPVSVLVKMLVSSGDVHEQAGNHKAAEDAYVQAIQLRRQQLEGRYELHGGTAEAKVDWRKVGRVPLKIFR